MLQQNSVFHGSTASVTTTAPAHLQPHQTQGQAVNANAPGGQVNLTTAVAGPSAEAVLGGGGGVYAGTASANPSGGVGIGTATKMSALPKQVQQ